MQEGTQRWKQEAQLNSNNIYIYIYKRSFPSLHARFEKMDGKTIFKMASNMRDKNEKL